MIAIDRLSKRYGRVQAVDRLSFRVEPGTIVGFLGRNGAGKSTTLRMLAGLIRPSGGHATIDGRPYAELDEPMRVVGFGLDAFSFHPGMSGRAQLTTLAVRCGVPARRVADVLTLVELEHAGGRPVRAYSLGMRQRLLLAAAMLGDPRAIVLDEPANGLDPQGHRWLRDFLRAQAAQGRAVLLSSHVLADVAETVDRVVVIARGTLVADAPVSELMGRARLRVESDRREQLADLLRRHGGHVETVNGEAMTVTGVDRRAVGAVAAAQGIALYELAEQRTSLEEAFFALTEPDGGGPR